MIKGKTSNYDELAFESQVIPKDDRPNPIPTKSIGQYDVWYNFLKPFNGFYICGAYVGR